MAFFSKAAEQGIAAAENGLGGCYGEGEGVLKITWSGQVGSTWRQPRLRTRQNKSIRGEKIR